MFIFNIKVDNTIRREVIRMQEAMLLAFLLTCFCCDLYSYKIPNTLIILGYITGFFAGNTCNFLYMEVFITRIIVVIAGCYFLYLINALGAGDIKMFSVVPAFVAELDMVKLIVASILVGGIISILLVLGKGISKTRFHFSTCIVIAYVLIVLGR